ncbi:hypothetical protein EMCRGX_G014396 [Ephydatia muelleri]
MFKIECAVKIGYTSSTSQVCKWNSSFCSKVEPALIANIEFKRPKRPKLASSVSKNVQKEGRLATGNAVIQLEAEAKISFKLKGCFSQCCRLLVDPTKTNTMCSISASCSKATISVNILA